MKLIVVYVAVLVLVAIPVYRRMRAVCRVAPGSRVWLVLAALATLGVVGALVPRIGNLRPPWSESPSGLLVIGARLLGLGALAAAAGPMTPAAGRNPVQRARMDRTSTTGPTMQVLA